MIKSAEDFEDELSLIEKRIDQAQEYLAKKDAKSGKARLALAQQGLQRLQTELGGDIQVKSEASSSGEMGDLTKLQQHIVNIQTRITNLDQQLDALILAVPSVPVDLSKPPKKSTDELLAETETALNEQRLALLVTAPFKNMATLLETYHAAQGVAFNGAAPMSSQEASSSSAPPLPSQIGVSFSAANLKQLIIDNVLPLMTTEHEEALQQGAMLIAAGEPHIVQFLFRRMVAEINAVPNITPNSLYAIFNLLLQRLPSKALEDEQLVQLTSFIDDQMNGMLAPDIFLSCQLIHSMACVLQLVLSRGDIQIFKHHQERLQLSVQRLKGRLDGMRDSITARLAAADVNSTDHYRAIKLANLTTSLKVIESALSADNIKDGRTNRQIYLGRLMQGCALLVQAAEVGAQMHGAVASFGASGPSALSAVVGLGVNIFKSAKKVFKHYHDNKNYFNALAMWQREFEKNWQSSDCERQKKLIDDLQTISPEAAEKNFWHHPSFSEGVLQLLMASYISDPRLRAKILGFFFDYFDKGRPYSKLSEDQKQPAAIKLRQQVSRCLLEIHALSEGPEAMAPYPYHLIGQDNFRRIQQMTDDDKLLYVQQPPAVSTDYNLAWEAWDHAYPGDTWLYNWVEERIHSTTQQPITAANLSILENIKAKHPSPGYKVSAWGEALIETYQPQLEACAAFKEALPAQANILTLRLDQSTIGIYIDLTNLPYDKALTNPYAAKTIDTVLQQGAQATIPELSETQQKQKLEYLQRFMTDAFNTPVRPGAVEIYGLNRNIKTYYGAGDASTSGTTGPVMSSR